MLPLELPGVGGPPVRPRWPGPAAVADEPAWLLEEDDPGRHAERAQTRQAAGRFVTTLTEVLAGFRPLGQLRALCRPDRFTAVAEHLRQSGARPAGAVRAGARTPVVGRLPTGAPPRQGRLATATPGERLAVRRVRLSDAIAGVAEIAVVLSRRDQVWAVAVRLERSGDRWLCAHLEIL
jgi:hypothetical protein